MSPPATPPVVLLCGGLGLRQRTDQDDLPKPLRPLPDGRPLLLHVLDYYRAFGLGEFVLCVGYGAAVIEAVLTREFQVSPLAIETGTGWRRFHAAGLRVTLVDSGPRAEKTQRLLDAEAHLRGLPFLLGYADVLSDFDLDRLITCHESTGVTLTLVATRVRSRYGELEVDPDSRVTSFREKPFSKALVSAGYFMCAPDLFAALAGDRLFESDVVPDLVAAGRVCAVVHAGLWLPFDTYKDFIDAELLVRREGCPWLAPA